ncbi:MULTISPECIES: DUF7519 family protein [Halolamina]|uniref:Uncharacterized protein n=1 Tax=Halolamina pelagica TaxID=699431 RepID=A0A1I5PVU2_9EURY|nr:MULTISPECIES: hypothetical protein [Halolamina]NHX34968.1 hypothetical protein [Halolamina sp. R1-12]SFP38047.1 hypothetical protein SAMN05216277_103124 [Halolamina pelagica]
MTEITREPSRFGIAVAAGFALLSVATTAVVATAGGAISGLGLVVLLAGLAVASRRLITNGGGILLLGALYVGYTGAPPLLVLVGALTGVLAWDAASNAVSVGEQLGKETDTMRGEVVHVVSSVLVGSLAVAVGYAVYLAAAGGQPIASVFLLVVGAVALVNALR